jgi:hypothetical protein
MITGAHVHQIFVWDPFINELNIVWMLMCSHVCLVWWRQHSSLNPILYIFLYFLGFEDILPLFQNKLLNFFKVQMYLRNKNMFIYNRI